MRTPILKLFALLALAAVSSLVLAGDPPGRVGRISSIEGQVSVSGNGGELSGDRGDRSSDALLNWPVTSQSRITSAHGARAEFRVGSTVVWLDGDSALEVAALDDNNLRLRLHYGSVSVRIRNREMASGFELDTAQGRVLMQEPGRLRVDAGRVPDTSVVSVFTGAAQVDGGGASLTLAAGKRAELHDSDVRTGPASGDDFDYWAMTRDERDGGDGRDQRSTSLRYVSEEVTGYEELDHYGDWRQDADYGPLWLPRTVPAGWAPYRDGRWTWIAPWGWTWVDHAPWGYAPSHYGRWVQVNRRWCWAPGRIMQRPVWAPALVGWVGGNHWNVPFGARGASGYQRTVPAVGWYPLAPRESFVPGYRSSQEHLRHLNSGHDDWNRRDGRGGRDVRENWRNGAGRHQGLTVVPHAQFSTQGTVVVREAPKALAAPTVLQNAPVAAGAPARMTDLRRIPGGDSANRGNSGDRGDHRDRGGRDDAARAQRWQQSGAVVRAPMPAPAPIVIAPGAPGALAPTAPIRIGAPNSSGRTVFIGPARPRHPVPQAVPTAPAPLLVQPQAAPAAPAPQFGAAPAQPAWGQREPGPRRFAPHRADSWNQPSPHAVVQQPQPIRPPQPVPVRVTQPAPPAPVAVLHATPPPAQPDAIKQASERRAAIMQQREQRIEAVEQQREPHRARRDGQSGPWQKR
jgi:hypothetical protein